MTPIYILELFIRTFANFFKLPKPEHMQVFPIKLQYQKRLSKIFKKRSIINYGFHMMSDSTVPSTFWAWKILKNFIKHKVLGIEIYLCLWSFSDFRHTTSGMLEIIGENSFDIRVQQGKSYQNSYFTYRDFQIKV